MCDLFITSFNRLHQQNKNTLKDVQVLRIFFLTLTLCNWKKNIEIHWYIHSIWNPCRTSWWVATNLPRAQRIIIEFDQTNWNNKTNDVFSPGVSISFYFFRRTPKHGGQPTGNGSRITAPREISCDVAKSPITWRSSKRDRKNKNTKQGWNPIPNTQCMMVWYIYLQLDSLGVKVGKYNTIHWVSGYIFG